MATEMMDKVRREQAAYANKITTQLFKELKPYIEQGKLSQLSGYVIINNEQDIDPHKYYLDLLLTEIKNKLYSNVTGGIEGYTDFLLCRMVREDKYTVPSLEEIPTARIIDDYDILEKTLDRVIRNMHAQKQLPLLGRIRKGKFEPCRSEFEAWKSLFDWEMKEE